MSEASRAVTPVTLTEEDIRKQRENYFVENQRGKLSRQNIEDSAKRFKYLIGLTDIFEHFIDAKAKKDERFKAILEETDVLDKKSKKAKSGDHRHRKTEDEEDKDLLADEKHEPETTVFTESPGYINGSLREYQVQGLNWMISLYENNISGILADEMGLGKTLQTISFLGFLRCIKGIAGPHLVLTPKSTLDNWRREFAQWMPEVQTVVVQGDKEGRKALVQDRLLACDFDVCIASYETVLREKSQFKKFAWQYIIIDEAHRIKNEESQLSQIIRLFSSRNRLLVTGTPLQNNLHELWALLNYLLPDVFSDSSMFDDWFESQGADQDTVVKTLHKVLRPFLLRRVKSDVEHALLPKKEVNLYTGMTDMQRRWYQSILARDLDAVNGAGDFSREKTRLLNIVMQLRKCCNHPYLFDGAEPGPPYTTDEHLVDNSGKMVVLDKLLKRLKAKGSRVLIFSQMSRQLDIFEDYCFMRGYKYCRIDGSTDHELRINAIDEYNKPGSDKFIFLLTTRAGGLGINLVTADTVVLYDSDWNPQADLQAMDRAHRIGQKKQVHVYRFVTDKSIEVKVVERAAKKLRLDQLVIQQGRAQQQKQLAQANKDELLDMIHHGAQSVFDDDKKVVGDDDLDIDALLERGEERTAELQNRFKGLGIEELNRFDGGDSAYAWKGEQLKVKEPEYDESSGPASRDRRRDYSINGYFKGMFRQGNRAEQRPRMTKGPKQLRLQDHQFYAQRLYDLQDQELAYHRQTQGYRVPLGERPEKATEEQVLDQQLEQWQVDHAEPLTEAEEAEKKELAQHAFDNWSRREFTNFIAQMANFGKDNVEDVALHCPEKTLEEVKFYHDAYWRRYGEIELFERYNSSIDAGQEKAEKLRLLTELIRKKVEGCDAPLQQLQFDLPLSTGSKRGVYSEEEDRFLVLQLYLFGLDAPNLYEQVREAIRESPVFRFDWFFLSRSPMELARRCQTLLGAIQKEHERPTKRARV